ncbi:MAG: DUF3333 domain-containing protein [Alphaproteobacteria bacterium]
MNNGTAPIAAADRQPSAIAETVKSGLRRRHASELRLKIYGLMAIGFALVALFILLLSVISKGYSAFQQTHINLEVYFDAAKIDPDGTRKIDDLRRGDYEGVARTAIRSAFPHAKGRRDRRALGKMLSTGAADKLRRMVLSNPKIIGTRQHVWLLASDEIDMLRKGYAKRNPDGSATKVSRKQVAWFDALAKKGAVERQFNWRFLTGGDSREPEQAGIWGAVVGSGLTMLVTLLLAFPVGVMAAIYLEEFAPKNVMHHVLPLSMPGILTGTIIGMAQALGETAPLLMVGMVAFIVDVPSGITDAATVLPVQVYIWADSPERAFEEKTAAAIMVLLAFLILMNAIAIVLRKKFERRW